MSKIGYEDFRQKLLNAGISDTAIRQYLKVDPHRSGAFSPCFVIDTAKVDVSDDELEFASALCFDSRPCRQLRHRRFERAIDNGDARPVLVSEGDSWFQHPCLREVIDHLDKDYLIWSLGALGDTADNMTGRNAEYMPGLRRWADRVKGFLFSAGGNDVLGKDPRGNPVLLTLLKQYQASEKAAWHIKWNEFNQVIGDLRTCYSRMITTIRSDKRFTMLPIFIHGYDYPFPFSPNSGDDREFDGWWLGDAFAERCFPETSFRRDVLKVMINKLYELMDELATTHRHVHVVNLRGSMPRRDMWNDEIHGTNDGYAAVAARFRAAIAPVLSQARP